jgi:hypothetical protein
MMVLKYHFLDDFNRKKIGYILEYFFFIFFLISKSNIIKNAKRNQVNMGYTRKAIKKKKKTK